MSIEPKDVLPLVPAAFDGLKALVGLVSPNAVAGVGIGQKITEFILDAEAKGLTPELTVEKLDELVLELKADIKFGT